MINKKQAGIAGVLVLLGTLAIFSSIRSADGQVSTGGTGVRTGGQAPTAGALQTTTSAPVRVRSTPPTTGQVLRATSSSTATWQTFSAAGADTDAIHDNVGSEISAIAEKTAVAAADLAVIEDSAASNAKKRVQLANMLAGYLRSATTLIDIKSATAPSAGQVLTATSDSAATWQAPAGEGTFGSEYFYAVLNADQGSVTAGTVVQFQNTLYERGSIALNTGTWVWTLPAGTYLLEADLVGRMNSAGEGSYRWYNQSGPTALGKAGVIVTPTVATNDFGTSGAIAIVTSAGSTQVTLRTVAQDDTLTVWKDYSIARITKISAPD